MAAQTEANASPKAKLFVITPIGGPGTQQRHHADMVFNVAIKPACEVAGISPPDRADLIDDTSMISTNIFRNVEEADLAIADLTFLNPNVMYELGIRHAVEKPVIHIAQEGTVLPFDTSGHTTLFFDVNNWGSLNALSGQIALAIHRMSTEGYEVSNPLTQARGRRALTGSTDRTDQMLGDLISRVEVLERQQTRPLATRPAIIPSIPASATTDNDVKSRTARFLNYLEIRLNGREIDSNEMQNLIDRSVSALQGIGPYSFDEFRDQVSKFDFGPKYLNNLTASGFSPR